MRIRKNTITRDTCVRRISFGFQARALLPGTRFRHLSSVSRAVLANDQAFGRPLLACEAQISGTFL